MKKNKFLKLASGLLVLCLLTTCVISTTFAKYVTSGDAKDTARVAKWGVEVAVQLPEEHSQKGFAKEYTNDASVTTVASATDKVVAPGTKGELMQFQITGTPEVSVNLEVKLTDGATGTPTDVFLLAGTYEDYTKEDNQTFTTADYYPVKYTLTFTPANGGAAQTLVNAKPLSDIVTEIAKLDDEYQVTDLTAWNALLGTYVITWDWAFEQSNDAADTLLGNLIVGGDFATGVDTSKFNLTINFALAITATQID